MRKNDTNSIFNAAWITLNRVCNLRCKWCYCSDTNFSDKNTMNYELAMKIVDFCASCHVKQILLIGGEPTLYKQIIPLISYIKERGMKCFLITNGLVFSNKSILDEYVKTGIDHISLSVKGNTSEEFFATTGVDAFNETIKALKNLNESNIKYSISEILTKDNIVSLAKSSSFFIENGVKKVNFGFCYNFDYSGESYRDFIKNNNPYELAYLFKKHYEEINNALIGLSWTLSQTLPSCVWDQKLLKIMQKRKQLYSICHLQKGGSLIFDPEGFVIPCNVMYQLKLGKIFRDFSDFKTYIDFRNRMDIKKIYSRLKGAPHEIGRAHV